MSQASPSQIPVEQAASGSGVTVAQEAPQVSPKAYETARAMAPNATPAQQTTLAAKLEAASSTSKVAEGAKGFTSDSLQGLLREGYDKTAGAVRNISGFLNDNKELVKIGGTALGSMFGPEAEYMDFKKSIYDKQMSNMRSPVAIDWTKRR